MGWSAVVRGAIMGGVFAREGVATLGGGRGFAGGSAAPAFLGALAGGRLVLAPLPASPRSARGAHGRLPGGFAAGRSPLRSCSHASPEGQLHQRHQPRLLSVCPALLEGNPWPPSPPPLQRGPVAVFVPPTGGLSPQVRCRHSAV